MLRGVSTAPVLTAADVERMSIPGKQVELVRGQLVVREPPGTWHGAVAANLAYLLGEFVRRHGLGLVFARDRGSRIGSVPATVPGPDAPARPAPSDSRNAPTARSACGWTSRYRSLPSRRDPGPQ